MGFNSTVIILNDYLHQIAEDKDFGRSLSDAILGLSVQREVHIPGATAIETHHADDVMVIAVGGNSGKNLGRGGHFRSTDLELIRNIADNLGYRLVRKRK